MYTTQARVEAYLKRSLTSDEETLFPDIAEYFSSFISGYCSRNWLDIDFDEYEIQETEERLFDGSGNREIYIDDFYDLQSVDLLDYEGNSFQLLNSDDDWILYPLNSTVKESIYLRNYRFTRGSGNIQVEAVFNSGEVPTDIVMVATKFVSDYTAQMNPTDFKKESIEGYAYELLSGQEKDESIQRILNTLDKWKRFDL